MLSWVAAFFEVMKLLRLRRKHKDAFIWGILCCILWGSVGIRTREGGLIAVSIAMLLGNIWNLYGWVRDEKNSAAKK